MAAQREERRLAAILVADKAGARVRITVQLVDAASSSHLWAERYDREPIDIFELQDELTQAIVATISGRLESAVAERVKSKSPADLNAYDLVMRAKLCHHRGRPEDNREALRLLDGAIELDPGFASAYAWKACVLGQSWVNNWCEEREATWQQVIDELNIALAQDDNDSDVHRILAAVNLAHGDHEKAQYHQERALSLNPNNDLIVVQHGELFTWLGRPEEGIEWIRKAMRLNPYHPERFWSHLGRACYTARNYPETAGALSRITRPDQTSHVFLAAALAQMGDATAAAAHVQVVLKETPAFSIRRYLSTLHYRLDGDRDHLRAGLLKAGMQE